MIIRNLLTILIFIFLGFNAAQAEILAQIDSNEVMLGESVNLVISSDQQLAGSPDFSVLEDDFQISGPSQSQNFIMRNGQSYINLAWTVTLFPKKAGDLIIPAFEIDDKKTLPLLLKVNQSQQSNNNQDDIYLTAEINKPKLYIGEQGIVTVKIFSSLSILSGQLDQPKVNGVELEPLGEEKNYRITEKGKTFKVIERNYLFFPSKVGEVSIESISLIADLEQKNFRRKRVSRVPSPLTVNVLAKPTDYPNNILWLPSSALTLNESWSNTDTYQVGTPITRTVTLTAEGLDKGQLPDLSQSPALTSIPGLKVYVDNSETNSLIKQQGVITTQVTKFAIIPGTSGDITLPAYQLTWFNTITKQIETITLPEKHITVAPITGAQPTVPVTTDTQATKSNGTATQAINDSKDEITDQPKTSIGDATIETLKKSVRFWQIVSAILALLVCIVAAALFIIFKSKSTAKPNTTKIKQPIDFTHAYQLLTSTNAKDKQQGIIEWWNLQYPQLAVSNLAQIAEQLDDKVVISALNSLENSLYANGSADKTNWLDWIKSGKVQPRIAAVSQENKLKALY